MFCKGRHVEVQLAGGLGNQLFQLANGIEIVLKTESQLILRPPKQGRVFALDCLGLIPHTWYNIWIKDSEIKVEKTKSQCTHFPKKVFQESTFSFSEVNVNSRCFKLLGYFQSFRYFNDYSNEIRRWILRELGISDFARINPGVILHVRLGDMLTNRDAHAYHGLISTGYIEKSLDYFGIEASELTVVTENKNLLDQQFPGLSNIVKACISDQDQITDFKKLVEYEKIIISNSTFSWWAAWLSNALTVAPKQWFAPNIIRVKPITDLIPENWKLK